MDSGKPSFIRTPITQHGLYISTNPRYGAEEHHKDLVEANNNLATAVKQHRETSELAEVCSAQEHNRDVQMVEEALSLQSKQISGDGGKHHELGEAHIVIASPAGIALTTPASTHIHTGEHAAITSERHTTISASKSFLVSAMEKVSLFAYRLGMRLMAAKGKVEIEAHSDAMHIIADKEMKIFSAKDKVHISSPKEILLTAGNSYIKISENGIEQGTDGKWKCHAADHSMEGPKTSPWLKKEWKDGVAPQNAQVVVRDELGKILAVERYAMNDTQNIDTSAAEHALHLIHEKSGEECLVRMENIDGVQHIASFGTTVNLTKARTKDTGSTGGNSNG